MHLPVALIRVDGNEKIGFGHIMRMMALANIISEDFDVCFLIKNATDWIKKEIELKFRIIDIPSFISFAEEADYIDKIQPNNTNLLILDGYNFDVFYQKSIINKLKVKTIAIDDFQPYPYITNVVINHAGLLNREQFQLKPYTKLYTGPQYALLRREFIDEASESLRRIEDVKTAFVSMGGTDHDVLSSIIAKLNHGGIARIILVVSNKAIFSNLITQYPQVELYSNLSAAEMIALMKQSDFAVLPPSTLSYEYCSVGGGLFIIQTTINQENIYKFLINSGCAKDFLSYNYPTTELINKQIANQKMYFYGSNNHLLKKIIFHAAFEEYFQLRKAKEDDLLLFFNWANDPESRNNSINKGLITIETHKRWFFNKINSENSVLYVLIANDLCLGSIRFDFEGNNALLSYSIDKKYRGKGLGSTILSLGINLIKNYFPNILQINGYIHQNNKASLYSFTKVGFFRNYNPPMHYNEFNYYSLYLKSHENRGS